MPNSEVLYYPSFEPSKKWIRSYLLFFDTVCSIIPEDYDINSLSKNTLELWSEIPDSFRPIPPNEKDIRIRGSNLRRLRKAFEQISNSEEFKQLNNTEENTISERMTIDHSFDELKFRGMTLLHNNKMSGSVFDLLREFNFININSQKTCDSGTLNNFYVVNKRAADLIVSLVADNIASSKGFNTITDQDLGFIVNSLNPIRYSAVGNPISLLSYSLTNCVVPQNIENLSIQEYVRIHDKYKEIHEPFQEVIYDLNKQYRLEYISDYSALEKDVNEISQNFNFEIEKIKNSSTMLTIKKWGIIGIGGLLSVIGAYTDNTELAVGATIGSISMQIIDTFGSNVIPEPRRKPVQRMIGNLQKDIIKKSQIKALI